ncbi:MAG: response regulator [Eubacteriales bacterium]|nr:response regulator [Eubacteriales bacterium]
MYKVVIADDEVWIGFGIKKLIHKSGKPFLVEGEAPNGIRAYELVREIRPDLLITDIRMPGLTGLELMRRLRQEGFSTSVVIISGYAEFEYAREALQLGAFDYLLKPVEEESLYAILDRYWLQGEQKTGKEKFMEELPEATDPRVRRIMEQIDREYTQKLSLGELADSCHLSIGHLSSLIRRETGMSFSEYVTKKRMEDAKGLLCKPELSVEEIAQSVGYQDYFYFTKAFKKYEGVSPSVYRKGHI